MRDARIETTDDVRERLEQINAMRDGRMLEEDRLISGVLEAIAAGHHNSAELARLLLTLWRP